MAEHNFDAFDFDWMPQVTQHPHTIISGESDGADITPRQVGGGEQTGSDFAVTFADASVEKGEVWQNNDIPDGFVSTSQFNDLLSIAVNEPDYKRGEEITDEKQTVAEEAIEDALGEVPDDADDHYVSGTDYKVVDPDDDETELSFDRDGNEKGVDVGGGTFDSSSVDGFDGNVMVWYGGMTGTIIGRTLDFNGLPWARFTGLDDESPYLVKGLFQPPIGWRGEADEDFYGSDNVESTDRSELARPVDNGGLGRKPRVARPPVLRPDMDGRFFISISRFNGGRMGEANLGFGVDDYDAFVESMEQRESSYDDIDYDGYDELDLRYAEDADEVLAAEFEGTIADIYDWYGGEGWQNKPDNAFEGTDSNGSGGFDLGDDDDNSAVEHPTEQERRFAQMIVQKMAGRDIDPEDDDAFEVDGETMNLSEIIDHNEGNFDVEPSKEAIRDEVYAEADGLTQ